MAREERYISPTSSAPTVPLQFMMIPAMETAMTYEAASMIMTAATKETMLVTVVDNLTVTVPTNLTGKKVIFEMKSLTAVETESKTEIDVEEQQAVPFLDMDSFSVMLHPSWATKDILHTFLWLLWIFDLAAISLSAHHY